MQETESKCKYVSKSFINVSMSLVFTTNWGHKNKNYLQIRNNNNNNNVYI